MINIIRSKRKTVSLRIEPDGNLLVRAPLGMPKSEIQAFIDSKQKWIDKNVKKIKTQLARASQMPALSASDIAGLKAKAKAYIPEKASFFAQKMGVKYKNITIRLQKTRWGSASTKGNLNFNCLLMLTPPEVIDSVIVHELCHLKQMNHSKKFYNEVLAVCPDYKKCAKWLKDNEFGIFSRISENVSERTVPNDRKPDKENRPQ